MKQQTRTYVAMAILAISFYSCKKSSTSTPTPTPTPTPAATTTTPTPTTGDVDGALVSLKIDVATTVAGVTYAVTTETGLATFFATSGNNSSYVDGGAVSVNSVSLDKQTNNSYIKSATVGQTPADVSFDGGSSWTVAGNGSVPAFTYSHTVAFPTFSGDIPASVTRSAGVTITLGSSAVTNADSVIVLVAAGSKSLIRTVSGTAASVTLSASDLSIFSAVTDNSAIMEVVPYRLTLKSEGSKNYAFIKERAVVKNININ